MDTEHNSIDTQAPFGACRQVDRGTKLRGYLHLSAFPFSSFFSLAGLALSPCHHEEHKCRGHTWRRSAGAPPLEELSRSSTKQNRVPLGKVKRRFQASYRISWLHLMELFGKDESEVKHEKW
jgi:hypothetical protein